MSPSALPAYVASRAGSVTESLKKNLRRSSSPRPETIHDGDDASIKSRSSQLSKESNPIDTLRIIAGERVRHGKCSPEFLEGMAERVGNKYVKILTGAEAERFFKKYVEEEEALENKGLRGELDKETRQDWTPVVFAITAWDIQRKVVDYYMTWRGSTAERTRRLNTRRISFLDDEFRRVANKLDRDYKRSPSITGSAVSRQTTESNSGRKSRPPTEILVSASEKPISDSKHLSIPEPPVSATDSVISLPYLNFVRGVPVGNRLALRLTNPDRNSMMSIPENAAPPNVVLTTVIEGVEATQPQTEQLLINTAVPAIIHQEQPSGLTPLMKSSASIMSAETQSSKSSRSGRYSTDKDRKPTTRSRPNSRERDRDSNKRRRRSSSPRDKDRDDDHHHPSRRRSDKKSSDDEKLGEFLIVLLDENFAHKGETWHGLERQASLKNQVTTHHDRHSPWSGPLARPDTISRHPTSRINDDSENSDDESASEVGGWKDTPVIPAKPLMEAMGLIPRASYYEPPVTIPFEIMRAAAAHSPPPGPPPPVIPRGSYTPSPRVSASSYVPAWISPAPSHHPSLPVSRPQSRAFSVYSPYTQPY